ncbi:hypothetical protein BAUCODRAFT_119418 [Baudoinia panamericana UAMH 10762]|uniref:Uncharacterized protein n=1 Tax=Baudoinia panamericana (strain UAMH 10762) TaxID=717646 RepID=M2N6W5_BAUPA|nr:uncharacterized protein BAUCODRAFT_119418 [Baudoinia panamericana UAMH 10762]EMC99848.1 hypothetical protein BAUCODRAFT_119418 [Baudoinia panamericana UAMH 10762]
MAAVRDPAFWKRFSTAVHLDEQKRPELKHSDSWLERQQRKTARRRWICPLFWLAFLIIIAAIVAVIIWLLKSGVLNGLHLGGEPVTALSTSTPQTNGTRTDG